MFLNISKFKDIGFFDENFFLYLEEMIFVEINQKGIKKFLLIQILKFCMTVVNHMTHQ